MNDNPRAYPCGDQQGTEPDYGMTLRDWFAGQALTSTMRLVTGHESEPGEGMAQTFARRAYEVADAMLEARKAKP